jgi:hypothetical protein
MKRNQLRSPQAMLSLCCELRPDDGQDPRLVQRREQAAPRRDRDARQVRYCRAVKQSLETSFMAGIGEIENYALCIENVQPSSRGGGLLVIVSAAGVTARDGAMIELALTAIAGRLRAEVAHDVPRKRTPHLTFRVVPQNETNPIPK